MLFLGLVILYMYVNMDPREKTIGLMEVRNTFVITAKAEWDYARSAETSILPGDWLSL